MTNKSKKACPITGCNEVLSRKAIRAWIRERKKYGLPTDVQPKKPSAAIRSAISYVASLPPPPSDYADYHCLTYWYQCYMSASYLDGYRQQIANLQQQMTYGEITLTAQLESYAQCLGGIIT